MARVRSTSLYDKGQRIVFWHDPDGEFAEMLPDPAADREREREQARWHPERETLELATAGAARVLGPDHGVTKALARVSITMSTADLWKARLAMKNLRRDQCEAIVAAAEDGGRC